MYTSKTNIENYLGVTLDASIDAFVDLTIQSITDYIENYCGEERFGKRIFEKPATDEDITKYFDGNGSTYLPVGDLKSLTSLEVDGLVLVKNEDFYLKPYNAPLEGRPYSNIELIQPSGSQSSRAKAVYEYDKEQRNIKVVGKFRYSDTVPADIQLIATQLAGSILKEKVGEDNLKEVKSEKFDDYTIDYVEIAKKAKTLKVTDILDQYKRKIKTANAGVIII
jgi:hypothetical protein